MLANPDIGVTQIAHHLGVPLPVHPLRANRECLRWLRTTALTQKPDAAAGGVEVVECPQW